MATLIKNILEPERLQTLEPDFGVLKILSRDLAAKTQFLVYASSQRKHLQALTTNNHPEEVRALITQLEQKGFAIEVFYTSNEGFTQALQWYDRMESEQETRVLHAAAQQKAEGKTALQVIKELWEQREHQDPGVFIKEMVRLSFQSGASDLHFQSEEAWVMMRVRIDGLLYSLAVFEHQEFWKYMQKLKFISGVKMNIDYVPQDGRFSFEASDREWTVRKVDARVNFMPGVKTENVVIRFLDASNGVENLEDIGFSARSLSLLQKYMQRTTGIIIVTGPTGSGKTTTLYAILRALNDGKKKIITLEDPIEYRVAGLQQSQINYDKGYDYETGLKSILRQDPDIILVGETRTKETAQIAINASLTGHLVFTTLHTNSALDSLVRLMNMGVEPYLLTPALQLILGQRLVRKFCPQCGRWEDARPEEDAEIRAMIAKMQDRDPEYGKDYQGKVFRADGCEHCNQTGYAGRLALIEVLEVTDALREAILAGLRGKALEEVIQKAGLFSLHADGILKVIEWKTSLEEVHRVSY